MLNSLLLRRLLGGILVVALLAVVAVTVSFFVENTRREKQPSPRHPAADVGLKAIHFTESDADRKKWELFAESGEYDKAAEKTTLATIRFIVESDQKGPVTVSAQHGEYFHASRILILKGNVVAKTEDGALFESNGVTYSTKNRIFSTKEHVRYVDKGLAVEGTGMDFTIEGFRATIHSKVSATLYPGKRGQ